MDETNAISDEFRRLGELQKNDPAAYELLVAQNREQQQQDPKPDVGKAILTSVAIGAILFWTLPSITVAFLF